MRLWYRVMAQLRSLVLRDRRYRELDEEIRLHIEQETAQNIARGMAPREARRHALRAFGGVDQTKEECREAWGLALVDNLSRDVRYAARRLARDWRFTLPAVLVLALGIGANTAMFSAVNTALFRPLPFDDADRLVNIYQNMGEASQPMANSYAAYEDISGYTDLFAGVVAFTFPLPVRFQADAGIGSGLAEYATSNYVEVHGLDLAMGRWFAAEEDSPAAGAVAILGHHAWINKFGAAPDVLGQTIRINGIPVTLIGVGPAGYNSSFHSGIVTDFWLPISSIATVDGDANELERTDDGNFMVRARLRDGVSLPQAQQAMTALGANLASEYPEADPGRGISVVPSEEVLIHPQLDRMLGAAAMFLMIIVGLLLAIACTNLATWLLVRGLARTKEVSIRLALGATRAQIVRHLLVESTLLAGAGGVLGYFLAEWTIRLVALMDLWVDVSGGLDYRVLGFTLALSLLTGVAFGLAPALNATRVGVVPALRGEGGGALQPGRRRFGLKNVLVVSQVALSCVLLVYEGIQLRSLAATQAVDLGFSLEGLAFVETDARFAGYDTDEATALNEALLARISALPGVEAAALAVGPPPAFHGSGELIIDGYESPDGEAPRVVWAWAGPDYFEVLGIPLLYGRTFTDFDRPETPGVTVINENMARRYFGTPNAVGRRIRLVAGSTEDGHPGAELEVIGVTADVLGSLDDEPRPLFYRSYRQGMAMASTVVVRAAVDPVSLLQPMLQTVRNVDDALPVIATKTLSQQLDESLGTQRAMGRLLGVLGVLGLSMACLGLYAVVSFAVSQRSREIGIRMTLGARQARVIWVLSRGVAKLLAVGVILGLALSWLVVRGSAGLIARLDEAADSVNLSGGPTADPMTFVLVMSLMVAVGLAATFFPAWRATRGNPLVAVRHQ